MCHESPGTERSNFLLYGDIFSQRLTLVNTHVVADTIDYLEMKFSFKTNDWDGLEKWVHFANSERVYDIRLSEDGVQKKDHLNLTAGKWRVYLHGNRYENGQVNERITTDEAVIYVAPTGTLDGEPFPEMPASVTEQILARLENVEQNGGGGSGGGISQETDPTVPSWAKQAQKPTYTASEVGALPDTTKIPEATSDLKNDSGYITIAVATLLNYYLKTETYAKTETYSQTEVDNLISGLDKRLNAIADSEDVDLDQLSEIVAYIKANKSLIDSITTDKVNIADIIDNLTTADAKKPLSAAQGKALKAMYDALPAWAKAANKPTYSKSEVGLGNVDNVRQYSAQNPPPYPVTSVNGMTGAVMLNANHVRARPETWMPSASEVGADPSGTADSKVAAHNVSEASHNDIRLLITGLTNRLNAIANSTDEDLDQLAEIVAYVKANKSLIDAIKIPTSLPASDVYSWAKQPQKPTYTASEVGAATAQQVAELSEEKADKENAVYILKAGETLDDVPEEYSVALDPNEEGGELPGGGNVQIDETLTQSGMAADAAVVGRKFAEQSEAIADQQTEIDGKQPKGDYLTAIPDEYVTEDELDSEINDLKAQGVQQTPLFAEGDTVEEQLAWLTANGDTTKPYVLADGFIYLFTQTTEVGGPSYTNLLPTAKDTDRTTVYGADYTGDGVKDGYSLNTRLSSSGGTSTSNATGMSASGFIPAKEGDILRIKGSSPKSGAGSYINSYNASNTLVKSYTLSQDGTPPDWVAKNAVTYAEGILTVTLSSTYFGTGFNAIRFSGVFDHTAIVTINEEINDNGGTVIVEKWASTGHAFVPANYDAEIANLKAVTNSHTAEISELNEKVSKVQDGISDLTDAEKLARIKMWDKPVYDFSPITLLSSERAKPALTTSDRTVSAVYAKYRALMAKYPRYITETNLGKSTASDTFAAVDILRFDFKEPDGLVESSRYVVNETKPKIIIMSGVHNEYAGIYGMYYALEEIAENPEFDDIRRNAHIIVIPCSNPFGLTSQTKIDGWQMSHVNANGVAIHNNFGVEHNTYNASANVGEFNYGGTEPYSELETQYIDKVMADNADAIAFISCHNYNNDIVFGSLAIWASSATAYMCNLAYRLIDKISKAWHTKYGSALQEAIETYRTDALPEGETRLGWAQFSTSAGTEQLNATKYGIQATNLEISDNMRVFKDAQFSSETMTHGAEVYANYIRVILSAYSYTDKDAYYK